MNLSTIGRADPIGSLRRMQMDDQAITLNKQKKAINDLTIQNQKQNLQVKQSQIDNKIAKQKELDTVIPWETFVTTFADQGEGEIGKFVTNLAQKTGLLGKDGLFSKRKQGELAKILATPRVSAQLSNKRVEHAANVFRNAKKAYLEKPDEKTKAALESATNNYNAAVGSNKNLKDGLKALKKTSTKYQASSKIAKLNNDLRNGLITQEEYVNAKNNLYESKGDKQFSPKMIQYQNVDTGETKYINVRNGDEILSARKNGFSPITAEQKGYQTKHGAIGAETEKEFTGAATKARGAIQTLTGMEQLLDRFESGKLANWEKALQQWGDAFGVPINTKNLSSKEAFNAFANQLALQSRNLGPGQVLAGQMSDRDVKFLQNMNPQLIISQGGNKLIIKMKIALAKRNQEIAKLIPKFKKQNRGVFDESEFDRYVDKHFKEKSIFGIPYGAKLYINSSGDVGTDPKTGLPVYEKDGVGYIPKF